MPVTPETLERIRSTRRGPVVDDLMAEIERLWTENAGLRCVMSANHETRRLWKGGALRVEGAYELER